MFPPGRGSVARVAPRVRRMKRCRCLRHASERPPWSPMPGASAALHLPVMPKPLKAEPLLPSASG